MSPTRKAAGGPTQVRRPWRSTARTVFQAFVAFAALAPAIAAGVQDATGYDLSRIGFVVVALGCAAAVTRVMATPAVELFLRQFLPFLAASPVPEAVVATSVAKKVSQKRAAKAPPTVPGPGTD